MKDTNFVNCTGLDDGPDAQNHRTSAYDIALMSRELLKNHPDIKKYTTIWMDTVRDGAFGLANTNKMVRFYPGCTGLKTGFTSGAGYCLSSSAARDGLELIAVVMGSETSQDRFAACKGMLDFGFANFALYTPALQDGISVPVTLGAADSVALIPASEGAILTQKSKLGGIAADIQAEPSAAAPIEQGQQLGMMVIRSGDQVLAEIPLIAAQAVPKLTWGQIFLKILGRIAMAAQ